jgi:UDP-arabinose 4-epimerase
LTQPIGGAVLVAGGAGYIGSHTCKMLARTGREPVVLDNMSTGHDWAAKFGPLYVGDIEDAPLVRKIVAEHRIADVIHFAAKIVVGESYTDPGKYFRENVGKTIRLLDALIEAGVTRIVFSSTAAVYGDPAVVPIRETEQWKPVNPYGEAKLFVERMLHWYGLAHGLKSVALRYFNAAGADPDGDLAEMHDPETHLIPLAFEAALGKRVLDLYGTDYPTPDGTCVRDYIHVCDLAKAHILSLDYLRAGGESTVLNLGTGVGRSVLDVLRAVTAVTGLDVSYNVRARRAGDSPELVADPSLARSVLGWTAEYRDLDRIVETAWASRKEHAGIG